MARTVNLTPAMTERQLQTAIVEMAGWLGFVFIYHTWLSARSTPGFPDLVLLHPGEGRILAVEVKGERGVVSEAQRRWLDGFEACGVPAYVWRPSDWHAGDIERTLRRRDI